MKCNLCTSEVIRILFHQDETEIWTNADDTRDFKNLKYPCDLLQCDHCGHIQQPNSTTLSSHLEKIYNSNQHALSTLPGVGNWGAEIGNEVLLYFDKINLNDVNSACEIGFGNDFYLQHLSKNKVSTLYGIEPSIGSDHISNGIHFIKGYADQKVDIGINFDLIYAMNVFEHVHDLSSIFTFINRHIKENGKLFFCIPNCEAQLISGDTALFIHEHYNYFTQKTLHELLKMNGFGSIQIYASLDTYYVHALKNKNIANDSKQTIIDKYDYVGKLETNLEILKQKCRGKKVAFHGVCNSLNNILSWSNLNFDFILFDNDITKKDKKYFGTTVLIPDSEILKGVEVVVILPRAYNLVIEKQYIDLHFQGEILKF
jgi:SAM-dependent methyltransferase